MRSKQDIKKFLLPISLFALLSLSTSSSTHAIEIELGLEYKKFSPRLFNKFAELDDSENLFSNFTSIENYEKEYSLVAHLYWGSFLPKISWGPYLHYILPNTVSNKADTSGSEQNTLKETDYSAILLGASAKLDLFRIFGLGFSLSAGISFGQHNLNQSVTIDNSTTSTLKASAYASELFLASAARWDFSFCYLLLRAKYLRYRTTNFSVDSASGSLFSSFSEGQRLSVLIDRQSNDINIKNTEYAFSAAVGLDF